MKGPFIEGRHRNGAVSGTGVKVREGDLNSGKKQGGEVHWPGAVASAEGCSPPNPARKEPSKCHHLLLLHLLTGSSFTDQTPPHWCRACCQCQGSCLGRRSKQIWRDKQKTRQTANALPWKAIAPPGWETLLSSPVRQPPQDAPPEEAPSPGPGTLYQLKVMEKGSQPNKVRGSQGQGKACTAPSC